MQEPLSRMAAWAAYYWPAGCYWRLGEVPRSSRELAGVGGASFFKGFPCVIAGVFLRAFAWGFV
uniref:Uncharacterized protein n=1 Tax=Streptomyces auratus AGR0001 TaxID=1160718 RepID=J2JPY0_9ACTN